MFFLGSYNIYLAFSQVLQFPEYEGSNFGSAAVISVIEGLDRFLIAIMLLYFAYGVYTLFLHPESSRQELALPDWLRVGHSVSSNKWSPRLSSLFSLSFF